MFMNHIREYISSRRFKDNSKKTYQLWLNRHCSFCNKDSIDITVEDLNRFYEMHRVRYADKSMQLAFNIFRAYFKFWGGESHCINYQRIDVPRARSNSHHSITKEEHLKMMNFLPESNFRQLQRKLIIWLLYDTGMRVGELTSLSLDSIQEYKATVETEKTTKSRAVFWGCATQRILERYLPIRNEIKRGKYLLIGLYHQGNYSDRISARSVERIIRKIATGAGVAGKVVPHSYRHSRIRRWFDTGLSAHQIILMSGHESTISLEHYMRLGTAEVEDMAKENM